MGWFWNSASEPDALSSLDPKLKDYLDASTAAQHRQSRPAPPPPPQQQSSFSSRVGLSSPDSPSQGDAFPTVPPQSLYPDGRYSHLWKTYTPPPRPAQQNSQEALQTVLSSFQSLRASASRAALENCVEEHLAENECFASGSLKQKMGGCRAESRRFARCYEVQTRLLKALGWMDQDLGDDEGLDIRERMRMRADEVWGEIVRREEMVQTAKKEGRAEPEFAPLKELGAGWVKRKDRGIKVEGSREEREAKLLAFFSEEKRSELAERLQRVPVVERELEIRLEIAEAEVHRGYGAKVGEFVEQEKVERRQRMDQGKSTMGDWLKWIGGWSQ